MNKTVKVVMLPTEKASNNLGDKVIQLRDNLLYYRTIIEKPSKEGEFVSINTYKTAIEMFQHLYLISDEEIKERDWFIFQNNVFQAKKVIGNVIEGDTGLDHFRLYCKKIIATTDSSLSICDGKCAKNECICNSIPQIPGSFIKAYIKVYNEGNPITEVQIEMEEVIGSKSKSVNDSYFVIKTRPDNTVIIHQSKMHSTDEVRLAIMNFLKDHNLSGISGIEVNKWTEENL